MKSDSKKGGRVVVQLEIEIEKLEFLFSNGDLCAADFRCLNFESKNLVRNLCLKSCANKIRCHRKHTETGSACVVSILETRSIALTPAHYGVNLLAKHE